MVWVGISWCELSHARVLIAVFGWMAGVWDVTRGVGWCGDFETFEKRGELR